MPCTSREGKGEEGGWWWIPLEHHRNSRSVYRKKWPCHSFLVMWRLWSHSETGRHGRVTVFWSGGDSGAIVRQKDMYMSQFLVWWRLWSHNETGRCGRVAVFWSGGDRAIVRQFSGLVVYAGAIVRQEDVAMSQFLVWWTDWSHSTTGRHGHVTISGLVDRLETRWDVLFQG